MNRITNYNRMGRSHVGLALLLMSILLLVSYAPAYAHGAKIDYRINTTIDITATYDSGEPMAQAQVSVFAPDDPQTPWLTGTSDAEGKFSFSPDPAKPGTWDIQVRQAGHGDIIHLPIGGDSASTGASGSFSTAQIIVMAACVVWGFIGTALYFSKRRAT
jgi:nickel transport protein